MESDLDFTDAITADLGATLIAVVLIICAAVLGVSAAIHRNEPSNSSLLITKHLPLDGGSQSDLLHSRLYPDPAQMLIEVRSDGAFLVHQNGAELRLEDSSSPYPSKAILFVFNHAAYQPALEKLLESNVSVEEMDVPQALRDERGFSPEFLAINVTSDKASIRPQLLRLLTSEKQASPSSGGEYSQENPSLLSRLTFLGALMVNGVWFLLSLALVVFIKRRQGKI